ncbi:DNA-binding transcriptional ArsR family regulator [Nocardioides thalensis]|uniref:DNA-binding transcriptional ArsR family regulator n=1 Tax=Nocardioides thalensis TaxID=1914755 RepID=A0A853C6X5_9ACTN|nr:hypothetical protein [Nocardioides thalensis]NYJ02228.1 DNA-binding transcriptional ArsR family regulator [Nocardioides thalensis]
MPGPLHDLVRNHDERGLDLYLLLRAVVSSDEATDAWDVALDARVWARGLGLPTANDPGTAAVSKTWRRLDDHGLITRERRGRSANITLLDEAGTGREYTYPSGKGRGRYFKLSEQFWTAEERWYRTLSLAAKAMLLVGSSLKPGFVLPLEQMPAWYGISGDTAARGLGELESVGLLEVTKRRRPEPLSPTKYVIENVYELKAPFAQDWRSRPLASVTTIHGDEDAEGAG